ILLCHPEPSFPDGHAAINGQQLYQEFQQSPDEQIAQNTARLCIDFDWLEDIATSLQDGAVAQSKAIAMILRSLVDQDAQCVCLTPDRFIAHHELITSLLDTKVEDDDQDNHYEILVKRLLHGPDGALLSNLVSGEIQTGMAHTYCIALEEESLDASALAGKLSSRLKDSLTEEDWLQQLCDEGPMLCVVLALSKRGEDLELDNRYVSALIAHAKEMREGTMTVEHLQDDWPTVLGALSVAERGQFRHELVSQVVADGHSALTPLLGIYDEELTTAMTCPDVHRNETRLRQALVNLSGQNDADQSRWLVGLLAEHPVLVEKAAERTRVNLRDRLQDYLKQEYASMLEAGPGGEAEDSDGDDNRSWIDAVHETARQLGMKLQEEPEEDESPDDAQNGAE
ncbi:hypothetical protein LCGC14_2357620, partial [marine sediment metagenome]